MNQKDGYYGYAERGNGIEPLPNGKRLATQISTKGRKHLFS